MSRTVRTTERISDITRQDKVTVTQHFTECLSLDPESVSQRLQHTHPTIAGGSTAQTHDEALASSPVGIGDHLTHPIRGGAEWITPIRRDKVEPYSLG